jgi:hypothetical protein
MRLKLFIVAFFSLILAGCIRHRASMPIGIFDPPASAFPELAAAGFNLIVAPASQSTLDTAEKSNLAVLMTEGGGLAAKPATQSSLRALDQHPAAWGWYLWDEPDLHQASPRRVRKQNHLLKRFVRKPTLVVFSSGGSVEKYPGVADLAAVDWYPVPWSSVGTVAREMRLARLGSEGGRFLAILQAFDWNIAPQLLDTDVPLRAPTQEELRCMTYLALMQGARGIIFYAYTAAGWNIATNAPLHKAVLEIGTEIRANEAMFGERVSWWPVATEFHGPPDSMYNEIGEASISLALFRARNAKNRYFLFAANTSAEPTDFSYKPPFGDDLAELQTSCDGEEFEVKDGWIRKTYDPFEVCIFGPIEGEIEDE